MNKLLEQEHIAEKTLYEILTQIEAWANKTYEGQKKTFGIVFCKDRLSPDENTFDYVEFLKSDGGGRTAAAMQLSEFGLSIKISQDGYVQLFKNREIIMEIMT